MQADDNLDLIPQFRTHGWHHLQIEYVIPRTPPLSRRLVWGIAATTGVIVVVRALSSGGLTIYAIKDLFDPKNKYLFTFLFDKMPTWLQVGFAYSAGIGDTYVNVFSRWRSTEKIVTGWFIKDLRPTPLANAVQPNIIWKKSYRWGSHFIEVANWASLASTFMTSGLGGGALAYHFWASNKNFAMFFTFLSGIFNFITSKGFRIKKGLDNFMKLCSEQLALPENLIWKILKLLAATLLLISIGGMYTFYTQHSIVHFLALFGVETTVDSLLVKISGNLLGSLATVQFFVGQLLSIFPPMQRQHNQHTERTIYAHRLANFLHSEEMSSYRVAAQQDSDCYLRLSQAAYWGGLTGSFLCCGTDAVIGNTLAAFNSSVGMLVQSFGIKNLYAAGLLAVIFAKVNTFSYIMFNNPEVFAMMNEIPANMANRILTQLKNEHRAVLQNSVNEISGLARDKLDSDKAETMIQLTVDACGLRHSEQKRLLGNSTLFSGNINGSSLKKPIDDHAQQKGYTF